MKNKNIHVDKIESNRKSMYLNIGIVKVIPRTQEDVRIWRDMDLR